MYLCISCQLRAKRTPPGETIALCETCGEKQKSVTQMKRDTKRLKQMVEEIRGHYEEVWDRYTELREEHEVVAKRGTSSYRYVVFIRPS